MCRKVAAADGVGRRVFPPSHKLVVGESSVLYFRRCVAAVVVFCMMLSGVQAQTRPLELRWNELAPMVMGQTVELAISGANIRGEVAAVRDDALVLDVKKTSDSKSFPKGNASIPKASVTLLKVVRTRGSG